MTLTQLVLLSFQTLENSNLDTNTAGVAACPDTRHWRKVTVTLTQLVLLSFQTLENSNLATHTAGVAVFPDTGE